MTADFSIKPTLTGPNVVLRPFTGGDLAAMSQALLDPEVRRLTGSVHDETAEFAASTPEQEELLQKDLLHQFKQRRDLSELGATADERR